VAPSNRVPHTDDLADDLVGLFVGVRDVVESSTMRGLAAGAVDGGAT
jgi:hypothetical protein